MKTVNFTEMKNGTKEDYELLEKFEKNFERQTADRIINYLSKRKMLWVFIFRTRPNCLPRRIFVKICSVLKNLKNFRL